MSRRRGEFEHRTSIFEGAFRAWSHLGGLEPSQLESKPASELDPLASPIENDPRITSMNKPRNPDGSLRREYAYEPLPRCGLAHPYVQAILSPWLGPDADNEAIQLGLTTLRTWWQHRRKGESGSAIAALGTEKMKGVVEGYTRHFFTLAHCLIVSDKEQPPRTLHSKLKTLDKLAKQRKGKRGKTAEEQDAPMATGSGDTMADSGLSPLERLHVAQRRQLAKNNFSHDQMNENGMVPMINLKGKCIPGKVDLPGVVDAISRNASQLAHRGGTANQVPASGAVSVPQQQNQYGDPNMTPVVFVSSTGDIQIAMTIDGITCAHCVKIVETVLKGCNGNRSPIDGLLDAAADRVLNSVLIKIDKSSNAKRIAFESARNLAMVGYTARTKEMSIVGSTADRKATMDLGALSTAFDVVANTGEKDVFDWTIPCTCPDNGVLRQDCARHSQMNTRIFEAFEARERNVKEYMAGCGMKYGMNCTCGPECRCQNCPIHNNPADEPSDQTQSTSMPSTAVQSRELFNEPPLQVDQAMNFFGMEPPSNTSVAAPTLLSHAASPPGVAPAPQAMMGVQQQQPAPMAQPPSNNAAGQNMEYRTQRNPSVISYGNSGLRQMSMTSETTFGRAMSGLSALSIDWENLDDFDVDVDHSAHINNSSTPSGNRRTSIRRSFVATAPTIGENSVQTSEGNGVGFKEI